MFCSVKAVISSSGARCMKFTLLADREISAIDLFGKRILETVGKIEVNQ